VERASGEKHRNVLTWTFARWIWQPRFHDQLLRGDDAINAVREYVRNDPANWRLDLEDPFRPG
jgi:hypothetical protein